MPDLSGRHSEHMPPLRLPLRNPPCFRKSHPLVSFRPSCARNGCRQSHGWGGLPTGKYDRRVGLQGNPRKLRKKSTRTGWDQKLAAQFILARRGQRQRWMSHRTCPRNSRPGKTSMNQENKGVWGKGPTPWQ